MLKLHRQLCGRKSNWGSPPAYRTKYDLLLVSLVLALSWSAATAREQSVTVKKGQLLSLITSITKPGQQAEDAKSVYFQKVFPLASSYGFKEEGSFVIHSFRAGDHQPHPAMSFFSWPNREAHEQFQRDPEWPKLQAMRTVIWQELRICQITVKDDLTLVFKEDRTYNISFLWLSKENPGDFRKYRDGMKRTVQALGGVYFLQLKVDAYQSFVDRQTRPDIVIITEWPNPEAHEKYLQSEAFKEHVHFFRSGVARFDSFGTQFHFPDPS